MQNRRVLIIVGSTLGLTALCCIGLIIFSAVYGEFSEDGRSAKQTQSLVGLKAACDGEGVPEAAVFDPSTSGRHPAVILQHLGEGDYIFGSTAWAYHPETLEEAELVVCLENVVETEVETCEYDLDDNAGEATITRMSLVADYRLVAAQTAEVLEEGMVKANPRECLDQETFVNDLGFTLRGDFGEALVPILEQYLEVP